MKFTYLEIAIQAYLEIAIPRLNLLLGQGRWKGSPIFPHLHAFWRSQAETLLELERKCGFSFLHFPMPCKASEGGIPGCSYNILNGWLDTQLEKSSYCFIASCTFSNPMPPAIVLYKAVSPSFYLWTRNWSHNMIPPLKLSPLAQFPIPRLTDNILFKIIP